MGKVSAASYLLNELGDGGVLGLQLVALGLSGSPAFVERLPEVRAGLPGSPVPAKLRCCGECASAEVWSPVRGPLFPLCRSLGRFSRCLHAPTWSRM